MEAIFSTLFYNTATTQTPYLCCLIQFLSSDVYGILLLPLLFRLIKPSDKGIIANQTHQCCLEVWLCTGSCIGCCWCPLPWEDFNMFDGVTWKQNINTSCYVIRNTLMNIALNTQNDRKDIFSWRSTDTHLSCPTHLYLTYRIKHRASCHGRKTLLQE